MALFLGAIATALWASSFVLVKMALPYMGPLTIAGLRYFMGFLILLPFLRSRRKSRAPRHRPWFLLVAIGLSAYTLGNGASFWALEYLTATTASFAISTVPLFMLAVGALRLAEIPTPRQIFGVFLGLAGGLLFFSPGLAPDEPLGLGIIAAGIVGFIIFSALGREVARERNVGTVALTAYPLAFGGGALLLLALPLEGLPAAPLTPWLIIIWLAFINTALAYILYNHALQTLTALEMSVMLNLSPIGTALLAWILLDERITLLQGAGIVIIVVAAFLVQQARSPQTPQ
jgi:drug/metabolite transporter (DMT)-like permease